MSQRRAPFSPPHYYQNQANTFPPYFQEANSPYGNGVNNPQAPVTPYEFFAKPKQPQWNSDNFQQMQGSGPGPYSAPNQKPNILAYFQDKNGQVDIDKMLNTVGQMANTFQQVSPLVKGLGSFVKGFK